MNVKIFKNGTKSIKDGFTLPFPSVQILKDKIDDEDMKEIDSFLVDYSTVTKQDCFIPQQNPIMDLVSRESYLVAAPTLLRIDMDSHVYIYEKKFYQSFLKVFGVGKVTDLSESYNWTESVSITISILSNQNFDDIFGSENIEEISRDSQVLHSFTFREVSLLVKNSFLYEYEGNENGIELGESFNSYINSVSEWVNKNGRDIDLKNLYNDSDVISVDSKSYTDFVGNLDKNKRLYDSTLVFNKEKILSYGKDFLIVISK